MLRVMEKQNTYPRTGIESALAALVTGKTLFNTTIN
jgi:hypothetical protein